MSKKISQLNPITSATIQETSLLELAVVDSNTSTGFKSVSTSVKDLREVMNPSIVQHRVDIKGVENINPVVVVLTTLILALI